MFVWNTGKTLHTLPFKTVPEKGLHSRIAFLVVTALKDEASTFCRGAGPSFIPLSLTHARSRLTSESWSQGAMVPVVYCGPGQSRLPLLESLLSEVTVGHILFCGFAGGLASSFEAGDIVLGTRLFGVGNPPMTLGYPESFPFRHRTGTILCVDRMISTPKEKARLHAETGGDIVEMESSGWHILAKKHQIPFWTIRVISDNASEILPPSLMDFVNSEGETFLRRVLWGLIFHPGLSIALMRLGKGMVRAHRGLRDLGRVVAGHPELLKELGGVPS